MKQIRKKQYIPDRDWVERSYKALLSFTMSHDFAEDSWEHLYYKEMLESRYVSEQDSFIHYIALY